MPATAPGPLGSRSPAAAAFSGRRPSSSPHRTWLLKLFMQKGCYSRILIFCCFVVLFFLFTQVDDFCFVALSLFFLVRHIFLKGPFLTPFLLVNQPAQGTRDVAHCWPPPRPPAARSSSPGPQARRPAPRRSAG